MSNANVKCMYDFFFSPVTNRYFNILKVEQQVRVATAMLLSNCGSGSRIKTTGLVAKEANECFDINNQCTKTTENNKVDI